MKLTQDNYKEYVPEKDQPLFLSLLYTLYELNNMLENEKLECKKMYIDIVTEHTQYSPERTDPCPDYYGMYILVFEDSLYETVGDYMTIDDLDNELLVLSDFIDYKV